MTKRTRHLLTGATLLAISSLIVKVLSAVYRIPFQNLVGNDGFYIYQQVYPIYGIGMSLTLTGVPLYISKCVVATKKEERQSMVQTLYTILCGLSLIICIGLLLFSHPLAIAMGDEHLMPVIEVVAFTFLATPYLGIWRGLYQGNHYLQPTAFSQLLEQSLRVLVILLSAVLLIQSQASLYTIASFAMAGSIVGGVAAIILLRMMKNRYPIVIEPTYFRFKKVSWKTLSSFLYECTIMSLSVSFMLVMQFCDSFLVTQRLHEAGIALSVCRNLKGIYDRGQPMIQVGLVIITVVIADFLPLLAKCWETHQVALFDTYKKRMIHLSLFLGMATSFGLCFLMPEVNTMLFENNEGGQALSLLMMSIFFMTMVLVLQAIAQSQNRLSLLWKSLVVGTIVKVIAGYTLIPSLHLIGASLSTLLALMATVLLYVYVERDKLKGEGRFYLKLCLVAVIYIISLWIWQTSISSFVHHRLSACLFGFLGVLVNGAILIIIARAVKLLTPKEWLMMPFGKYVLKVVRKHEN